MGVMTPSLGTIPAFEAHCLGNTMGEALSNLGLKGLASRTFDADFRI